MKILLGSPAKQDMRVFKEYLEGINSLIIPEGVTLDKYFILNDCDELKELLKPNEYEVMNTGDVYITDEQTHRWSEENVDKMCILRNKLRDKVINDGYDYLFMVDTDIILNSNTLVQLLSDNLELVANIFWTKSEPRPDSPIWSNCWDYDTATYAPGSFEKWWQPGIHEVGGTGACFLIKREVFEKGIDWSPIPNIKYALWGEDRWFAIRSVCAGYKIYIDTYNPVRHLYRLSEYEAYMKEKSDKLDNN